jgi:hypothetical protein
MHRPRITTTKRNIAVAIGSGIAALAIGVSAAGWGSAVLNGSQSVTTGGPANVTISSPTTGAVVVGGTVTFAPVTNANPTFAGSLNEIDVTNNGTATAYIDAFSISGAPVGAAGTALQNQLQLCSYPLPNGTRIWDGLLSGAITGPLAFPGGSIAAGATESFDFQVYAGAVTTGCNVETAPALTTAAAYATDVVSVNATFGNS